MTPRPHARTRRAALATLMFAGASLLTLPGCDPRTMLYFLQPFDPTIPAPGPSLKGKKIVVLTHVPAGVGESYSDLARDLTREFQSTLRKNVKKIAIVDQDKISAWMEAHPSWTDATEAGKDFEADMAIMIDVSDFQATDPKSPDLMEGTSNIHIHAWEFGYPKNAKGKEQKNEPKEWDQVYEDQVDTTFPLRGPVPRDTGVSESAFKLKFLKLVATELSWRFVEHAPGDDIQDVKFNNNTR